MEAICSSETSVDTQRTTLRYIQEDDTLHNYRCENLKSYIGEDLFHPPVKLVFFSVHSQQKLETITY
jgi:hypothetical protein